MPCRDEEHIREVSHESMSKVSGRKHSDESMDNASLKFLAQEETGSGNLMPENPSCMDQNLNLEIADMGGGAGTSSSWRFVCKDRTKAEGFDGKLEENTYSISDHYDAGMNLPEAATDSARRIRTLKIKATSREPDNVSRIPKLRGSHQRTSKDAEDSSANFRDMRLQRSRSTRNHQGLYNHSDQNLSTQRMLDNPGGKLSWLMLSKHEQGYRYIPQLGDEVIYLRQVNFSSTPRFWSFSFEF